MPSERGKTDEKNAHIPLTFDQRDSTHKCIYANIRGLRQGSGELAALIELEKPQFIFMTECHITKGEPIDTWIPSGYKVVTETWRTNHGGGLLFRSEEHQLCDPLDQKLLNKYHIDEVAEITGIKYGGVIYIDAYSNKSQEAKLLVQVLHKLKAHLREDHFVFTGDVNSHNKEWIISKSDTNEAGELLEEFTQLDRMFQLIDFATRGENTLDRIIRDLPGNAFENHTLAQATMSPYVLKSKSNNHHHWLGQLLLL